MPRKKPPVPGPGKGNYIRCESKGCKKKVMTGRKHCTVHEIAYVEYMMEKNPSLSDLVEQIVRKVMMDEGLI